MAIPVEQSWGDGASGVNLSSVSAAAADLALSGARAHQAHQMRVAAMAESNLQAWSHLLMQGSARSIRADQVALTGRESQVIGESAALIGILAKVFSGVG